MSCARCGGGDAERAGHRRGRRGRVVRRRRRGRRRRGRERRQWERDGEDVSGYRTVLIDATEIGGRTSRRSWRRSEQVVDALGVGRRGWAAAPRRQHDEERYEKRTQRGQTRRSTEIEASTSASSDGKNGQTMESTNDFMTDGSLLQLYHAGVQRHASVWIIGASEDTDERVSSR